MKKNPTPRFTLHRETLLCLTLGETLREARVQGGSADQTNCDRTHYPTTNPPGI